MEYYDERRKILFRKKYILWYSIKYVPKYKYTDIKIQNLKK